MTPDTQNAPSLSEQQRLDTLLQSLAEFMLQGERDGSVRYSADTLPTIARWTVQRFKVTEHFGRLADNLREIPTTTT